jgi:hypothetical protein
MFSLEEERQRAAIQELEKKIEDFRNAASLIMAKADTPSYPPNIIVPQLTDIRSCFGRISIEFMPLHLVSGITCRFLDELLNTVLFIFTQILTEPSPGYLGEDVVRKFDTLRDNFYCLYHIEAKSTA